MAIKLGRWQSRASRRATAPEHETALPTPPADDAQTVEKGIVADDLMDLNKTVRRSVHHP